LVEPSCAHIFVSSIAKKRFRLNW